MLFNNLKAYVLQIYNRLLPSVCILCSYPTDSSSNICQPCLKDLPILPYNCQRCGRFLSLSTAALCGACLLNPPPFDKIFALYPYESPIAELIIQLKFQKRLTHARAFGSLLSHKIRNSWYKNLPLPDVIIPIPLHRERLQARGFNQALEIAKFASNMLHIPLDRHRVTRHKPTAAQSGLSAAARKRNLANAFSVQGYYTGKSIALIDDVITTGHTVDECCKILKQSGAKMIHVWCCARRG